MIRLMGKASLALGCSCLAMMIAAQASAQTVDTSSVTASAAPTGSTADANGSVASLNTTSEDAGIVVTGSRIVRDGTTAPTPVTVLGSDYLNARGQTNIADALNELPSFRPAQTPAGSSNRSQLAGTNFVDLRGLGSNRTLVLVDGKRFVPSSGTGQVDLNLIPSILISRTEVVTGGASASYGSDAVAGVVNLILKKDYVGLEGDLQYGRSQLGDGIEYRASLHAGTSLLDDKLHISAAGEYYKDDGVGDQYTRAWGRAQPGLVVNPSPSTNGLPARIITTNVHDSLMTDGGLITSGPLKGIQFNSGGDPVPFAFGQLAGSQLMIGGDGASFFYRGFNLLPKLERAIGYGRISYDVSDALRLYTDVSYSDSTSHGQSATAYNYGNLTIRTDNAFLPDSIKAAAAADGVTSFGFGRWDGDLGPALTHTTTRTTRIVSGFEGKLGGGWTYDGSYEYGRNRYISTLSNSRQSALFKNAIDAVLDPATGAIVCRSTLTNPGNGCVPWNPFGVGQNADSAKNYFTGMQHYSQLTEEQAAGLNIQGPVLTLPAGPLGVAFGGEYRKESANANSDAASQANLWDYGNPKPLRGSYDVKEVYGEVNVPVLKDVRFAKSLNLTGAVRYTDYSTSGGVVTWKVGGEWAPVEGVRLRATRSRDIRAANITELFTPSVLGPTTLRDSRRDDSYFVNVITSGNPGLTPEKADTFTGGVVLTPARGLRVAVDYYNIKINNAISTLTAQDILDRCNAGESALCALVVRDATGTVTQINNRYINVASILNRGLDIEFGYQMPLSEVSPTLPGTVSFRAFATKTLKYTQSDGVVTTRLDNQLTSNGVPSWIVNTNLGYDIGRLSLLLQGRFISSGKYDNRYIDGVDINDNKIPSRFYLNLSGQFDLFDTKRGKVQIYTVINNLLDKDPPYVPVYGTGATNFAYYDVIGRYFKVGIRFGL